MRRENRLPMSAGLILILLISMSAPYARKSSGYKTGSVIFFHPDGTGYSHWAAYRMLDEGPDGMTNWDRMSNLGLYRSHLANSAVSSSNGGATVHAFGMKAGYHDYGITPGSNRKSLSGVDYSILLEAGKAGKLTAILNSGHIAEPGTGVFAANAANRNLTDTISEQIIMSGVDIIMAGGEALLLSEGETGRFGVEGVRKDGKNLITLAGKQGYTIVYTRDELISLSDTVSKVLGVFAPGHTFNAMPEEALAERRLPLYVKDAPTIGEMLQKTLSIFAARKEKDFLLVVEEEGTDNFANKNNAPGEFEALRRADRAIGIALDYVQKNSRTLLLTAADSDAGGMEIIPILDSDRYNKPLPTKDENGAPIDGREGSGTLPFVSAPDQAGIRHHFAVVWSCFDDVGGGIIARAHGLNAERLPVHVDNTDIYRMMYATLFGKWLD